MYWKIDWKLDKICKRLHVKNCRLSNIITRNINKVLKSLVMYWTIEMLNVKFNKTLFNILLCKAIVYYYRVVKVSVELKTKRNDGRVSWEKVQ